MPRTLLQICQDASLMCGVPVPQKIVGSNDRNARLFLGCANHTIQKMMRHADGKGWSDLRSEWVFLMYDGNHSIDLPADFRKQVQGTLHRENYAGGMVRPGTAATWSLWRNGLTKPFAPYGNRVMNKKLYFEPKIQGNEMIRMEYQSKWFVERVGRPSDYTEVVLDGIGKVYTTKAGVVPVDGELTMTITQMQALGYLDPYLGGWDTTAEGGWDGDVWDGALGEFYNYLRREEPLADQRVRQEKFTADTDVPALSYDHVIELGIIAKFKQNRGMAYEEEHAEFMEAMGEAAAIDGGGAGVINLDGTDYDNPDYWHIEGGRTQVVVS